MEIKDILSELITVATSALNERGCPENFDLEDFISTLEDYYSELDEIGEFYFLDENDSYNFDDEDNYQRAELRLYIHVIKIKVMNRNQERVLSDAMIYDIKNKIYTSIRMNNVELWILVDNIVNTYLTDDWDSFKQTMTDNIEYYEDEIITELNTQLMEDSFNQAENGN